MTQKVVALGDIVVDPALQIRDALDEETVSSYMEDFDLLPAVLLFETPAGLLLADGFHRLEAARRLGRGDLTAEVRTGTRTDALDEAIKINLRHGQRYSEAERSRAIRVYEEHHQDSSAREVAAQLRVNRSTIDNIRHARAARAAVRCGRQRLVECGGRRHVRLDDAIKEIERYGWRLDVDRGGWRCLEHVAREEQPGAAAGGHRCR